MVHVEDASHPVFDGLPSAFTIENDEWYTYDRSPRQDVHVLANVDENSYEPARTVKIGDHPVIWTNPHYKARNVYFQFGHKKELFSQPTRRCRSPNSMSALSDSARFILDRMEPDRRYEPQDLRAFDPDVSIERLREIMHELWVSRQVERVDYSGWRRHRSAAPHRPRPVSREMKPVKPEDLFDHATFEDFFK